MTLHRALTKEVEQHKESVTYTFYLLLVCLRLSQKLHQEISLFIFRKFFQFQESGPGQQLPVHTACCLQILPSVL